MDEKLILPEGSDARAKEIQHEHKEARARDLLNLVVGPLVIVVCLIQGWAIWKQSHDAQEQATKLESVVICQSAYNKAFIENLRIRSDISSQGTEAVQKLINAFGLNPTPEESILLFKEYANATDRIEDERAKHPLLPFPDCGAKEVERSQG